MRKRISLAVFALIILIFGSISQAANYGSSSLDYELDELNKELDSLKNNYTSSSYYGNTYSNYYNNTYNSNYVTRSNTTTSSSYFSNSLNEGNLSSSSSSIPSKENQLIIEDDANLLTDSEEKSLKEIMGKLTEYGNIIFKSIDTNTTTADSYAKSYYNGRFGSNSGTLFLIDMKNRKIYIFSNGANYQKITDEKAEIITDNIYKLATKKEYYECAKQAFDQILTVLEGGKIAEPMKYISNGVLSVMVALFINFAIFKIATNNRKATGNEQIRECVNHFEHTTPTVTKTGTHRVYSPPSSSSGGGSSGGGGGGGRRWRRWRRP